MATTGDGTTIATGVGTTAIGVGVIIAGTAITGATGKWRRRHGRGTGWGQWFDDEKDHPPVLKTLQETRRQAIASESGSPFRDCVLPSLCPSPRDLASRRLVAKKRHPKERGHQIVEE